MVSILESAGHLLSYERGYRKECKRRLWWQPEKQF